MVTTPQGWVAAPVPDEAVTAAKELHASKFTPGDDSHIRSSIGDDDYRWCGELGEMFTDQVFAFRHYTYVWQSNKNDYSPDFNIGNYNVDVKTKNRGCTPRLKPDWYATVKHDQFVIAKQHEIAAYIFCDYDCNNQWIYMLGKISYAQFDTLKIERNVGDIVTRANAKDDFVVKEKSWDVRLTDLLVPIRWKKAAA